MAEIPTPYTAGKPAPKESVENLRTRIPGWGADLDPADRPSYPREQPGIDTGAHWDFPERQPEKWPRERSVEHAFLPPVFGTSTPPGPDSIKPTYPSPPPTPASTAARQGWGAEAAGFAECEAPSAAVHLSDRGVIATGLLTVVRGFWRTIQPAVMPAGLAPPEESHGCPGFSFTGVTRIRAMRRPSIAVTVNTWPATSTRSPVRGRRPRRSKTNPATVS